MKLAYVFFYFGTNSTIFLDILICTISLFSCYYLQNSRMNSFKEGRVCDTCIYIYIHIILFCLLSFYCSFTFFSLTLLTFILIYVTFSPFLLHQPKHLLLSLVFPINFHPFFLCSLTIENSSIFASKSNTQQS